MRRENEYNAVVMLDIETLGVESNAVITQIGLTISDSDDLVNPSVLHCTTLPIEPQLVLGGRVNASTVLFWMRQSEEARAHLQECEGEDYEELRAVLRGINRRITTATANADSVEFWARGPQFDYVILGNLMARAGIEPVWQYNQVRDLRTAASLVGAKTNDAVAAFTSAENRAPIAHHPLDDCLVQLYLLTRVYEGLSK